MALAVDWRKVHAEVFWLELIVLGRAWETKSSSDDPFRAFFQRARLEMWERQLIRT